MTMITSNYSVYDNDIVVTVVTTVATQVTTMKVTKKVHIPSSSSAENIISAITVAGDSKLI